MLPRRAGSLAAGTFDGIIFYGKTETEKEYHPHSGLDALLLSIGVILLVVFTFKNENTTLGTGPVRDLNDGWGFRTENSDREVSVTLPYFAKSKPYEAIYLSRTVDEELAGKTLAFLSADKTLFVTLDGEKLYSFGWDGDHWFGKTPGSIKNYVDIPCLP